MPAPDVPAGLDLDELKTYLDTPRESKNDFLKMLLAAAFGFALSETGRQLSPLEDQTVTRKVRGNRYVRLPDLRFDEDTVLTLDDVVLVEGDDFELIRRPARADGPAPQVRLTCLGRVLVVEGDFGFSPLPWDLKDAIYTHTARNYHERTAMYADTTNSNEYGDRRFLRNLPPRVMEIYDDYKVPSDTFGLE